MTTNEEVSEFLEHYGVKGMKWGVRRRSEKSGDSFKEKYSKLSSRDKTISNLVGFGASFVSANLVAGSTLNVPLAVAAGATTGIAGQRYMVNRLSKK